MVHRKNGSKPNKEKDKHMENQSNKFQLFQNKSCHKYGLYSNMTHTSPFQEPLEI